MDMFKKIDLISQVERKYHWHQILPNVVLGCFDLTMCLV